MARDKKRIIILVSSIIGILFSGWLSISSLILKSCPMKEGCPYVWGWPACVYGFLLFLTLLILSIFAIKTRRRVMKSIEWVSFGGILFSIYSTYLEIFFPTCLGGKCEYSLLIPTCVYGFIIYLIIFIYSFKIKKSEKKIKN